MRRIIACLLFICSLAPLHSMGGLLGGPSPAEKKKQRERYLLNELPGQMSRNPILPPAGKPLPPPPSPVLQYNSYQVIGKLDTPVAILQLGEEILYQKSLVAKIEQGAGAQKYLALTEAQKRYDYVTNPQRRVEYADIIATMKSRFDAAQKTWNPYQKQIDQINQKIKKLEQTRDTAIKNLDKITLQQSKVMTDQIQRYMSRIRLMTGYRAQLAQIGQFKRALNRRIQEYESQAAMGKPLPGSSQLSSMTRSYSYLLSAGDRLMKAQSKVLQYTERLKNATVVLNRLKSLEPLYKANEEKKQHHDAVIATIQTNNVLLQKNAAAYPTNPAPKGAPLTYGSLVALHCRALSGNNPYMWLPLWTNDAYDPTAEHMTGSQELMFNKPNVDPAQQSLTGAQYFVIRKAGLPTDRDVMKYGDEVEILSMVTSDPNTKKPQGLGMGEKWWVPDTSAPWWTNYPNIAVGPNNDAYGIKKTGLPRLEADRETFTLQSARGAAVGTQIYANDVVTIKTSSSHPKYPNMFMWARSNPPGRPAGFGQIVLTGALAKDTLGLEAIKTDRSQTTRNQFAIFSGPPTALAQQAYHNALQSTPAYLPEGSIVAIRASNGKYLTANGSNVTATAASSTDPAAQFKVHYQGEGWLGLESVKEKTFLQGSSYPELYGKLFDQQAATYWHWMFTGSPQAAYLHSEVSSRTLSIQPNGSLFMTEILGANCLFAIEIQTHKKKTVVPPAISQTTKQPVKPVKKPVAQPKVVKPAKKKPVTQPKVIRPVEPKIIKPAKKKSVVQPKVMKPVKPKIVKPVKKPVVEPKVVKLHVRTRNGEPTTVAPAKPIVVPAKKPAPSVDKTHALTLKNNNLKVDWLTNHKFRLPAKGSGYLTFDMLATRDAYFTFDAQPNADTVSKAALALHLGGLNNTRTDILEKGKVIKSYAKKDALIVPNRKHYYWIGFANGKLTFGSNTHPGDKPVFVFSNEQTRKVRYIGVSNADALVKLSLINIVPRHKARPREVVQKVRVGYGYPRRGGMRSRRYRRWR